MKLLIAKVENFGSYTDLEFDYSNQGLCLIYGPTGAGKSTLQDVPTWILFGITSKDGNVDEIRSWTNPDLPTTGSIEILVKDNPLVVKRTRGKATENDLYWIDEEGQEHRGKDITETQTLLEKELGISSELYLSAAFYNEFSSTSTFFTNKSKEKRELFENVANLTFPIELAERTSIGKKETRKIISELSSQFNKETGRLEQLRKSEESSKRDVEEWSKNQEKVIKEFQTRSQKFDEEKKLTVEALTTKHSFQEQQKQKELDKLLDQIDKVDKVIEKHQSKCDKCGQLNINHTSAQSKRTHLVSKLQILDSTINSYASQLEKERLKENTFQDRIKEELDKINPFLNRLSHTQREIPEQQNKIDLLKVTLDEAEHKISSLSTLYDLSFIMRGKLLQKSIKEIEYQTNAYLESYFDAELRVQFDLSESDNLEVFIWKNGNSCTFKQLSKGQRSLLKLTFSLSVMKAASNKAGVHFNTIMFDEALDGLDTELKIKSFNLFSELEKSHDTILIIDHSIELQNIFNKHYQVSLKNDRSYVQEIV